MENTDQNRLILYGSLPLLTTHSVNRPVNKKLLTVQSAVFIYFCFTDMLNVSLSQLQVQNNTPSDAKIYPLGSWLGPLLFPSDYVCTWLQGIGEEKLLMKHKQKNSKYSGLFKLIYSEETKCTVPVNSCCRTNRGISHLFCEFSQNDSNYFYFCFRKVIVNLIKEVTY